MKEKKKFIVFGMLFLIFLNFSFFWIGYQCFLHPELGKFSILGMNEEDHILILQVSPCHNAVSYEAIVYDDGKNIYQTDSSEEKIYLENFEAEYDHEITISVIAKNKNSEEQVSENTYHYVNKDSSFLKEENHFLAKDSDLVLSVLGFHENTDLTLSLYYDKNKFYETLLQTEKVVIPYQVVGGYSGRVTAYLTNKNGRIVSSFSFYLNTPVVGKLDITSTFAEKNRWDDVQLKFLGGENANHFYVDFYRDGMFESTQEFVPEKKSIFIPASFFQENAHYRLVLRAMYEDFSEIAESDEVELDVGMKETTNAVYVSHNPFAIRSGTKVSLHTITDDATIYYTTDGSIPTSSSLVYKEPFTITDNMVINAYAVSRNRFDSIVQTYPFQISTKTPVIYLSPSNQNENYGVRETGFTNEMEMMNKVADVVQRELVANGIIVYRNFPSGDMNVWSSKSRQVKADFHFAIHSNASSHHTARGPEIYVDKATSKSFSIASNIYENLWTIYDGNTNYEYHRGVKYADGSLGEANDSYLPCSSLIELAYHDESNDAAWITNNIEKIGQNLARTIISYYN